MNSVHKITQLKSKNKMLSHHFIVPAADNAPCVVRWGRPFWGWAGQFSNQRFFYKSLWRFLRQKPVYLE